MTVLVLTHQFDPTADLVINELNHRGVSVFRCDAAQFPQQLRLSAHLRRTWIGTLRTTDREVALESIRAVYFRRPSRFAFSKDMSATERNFAAAEARIGFGGVLASLQCRWVNHPHRISETEYKPLQLAVAVESGFRVPATLITSDPDDAREFADSLSNEVVYKSLSGGPAGEHGQAVALYTSVVSGEDFRHPDIGQTAHLFQEWVPKRCDIRVTAVGDESFAVEIYTRESTQAAIDWRADYESHEYRVTEVPGGAWSGITTMMNTLGLSFGAFDFVVTPDGEWVFLELNANGQWGWLQLATGLPISAAMADLLAKPDSTHV